MQTGFDNLEEIYLKPRKKLGLVSLEGRRPWKPYS